MKEHFLDVEEIETDPPSRGGSVAPTFALAPLYANLLVGYPRKAGEIAQDEDKLEGL